MMTEQDCFSVFVGVGHVLHGVHRLVPEGSYLRSSIPRSKINLSRKLEIKPDEQQPQGLVMQTNHIARQEWPISDDLGSRRPAIQKKEKKKWSKSANSVE